jgi:hypothetical protein
MKDPRWFTYCAWFMVPITILNVIDEATLRSNGEAAFAWFIALFWVVNYLAKDKL